jgi:5'-3' exonuclease
VEKKFGVLPESIPDFLALVGDAADGIPGIPRWGAKSSALVLSRYRHIDAIPDDAADWDVKLRGAQALALSLRERRQEAELYRRLATLRRDVPLRESLDDLHWRGADRDAVSQLQAELATERLSAAVSRFAD